VCDEDARNTASTEAFFIARAASDSVARPRIHTYT
jgi:hypothetical protein